MNTEIEEILERDKKVENEKSDSLLKTRTETDLEDQSITHTDGKVKILLWKPEINYCSEELGHIALETPNHYFSLWPHNPDKNNYYTTTGKLHTYAEDRIVKGRPEDHWLILPKIDSLAIDQEIEKIKKCCEVGIIDWSLFAGTMFQNVTSSPHKNVVLNCTSSIRHLLSSSNVNSDVMNRVGWLVPNSYPDLVCLSWKSIVWMLAMLPACSSLLIDSSYLFLTISACGGGALTYMLNEVLKPRYADEYSKYFHFPMKLLITFYIVGINLVYAYFISPRIHISNIFGKRIIDFLIVFVANWVTPGLIVKPFGYFYYNLCGYSEFVKPQIMFNLCKAVLLSDIIDPKMEHVELLLLNLIYGVCGFFGFFTSIAISSFMNNKNITFAISTLLPVVLLGFVFYKWVSPGVHNGARNALDSINYLIHPVNMFHNHEMCDDKTKLELFEPLQLSFTQEFMRLVFINIAYWAIFSALTKFTTFDTLVIASISASGGIIGYLIGTLVYKSCDRVFSNFECWKQPSFPHKKRESELLSKQGLFSPHKSKRNYGTLLSEIRQKHELTGDSRLADSESENPRNF